MQAVVMHINLHKNNVTEIYNDRGFLILFSNQINVCSLEGFEVSKINIKYCTGFNSTGIGINLLIMSKIFVLQI